MNKTLAEMAREFARASMEAEMQQEGVPRHVHGSTSGYNNYGCRGPLCRAAMADRRPTPSPPRWEPDRIVWETVREVLKSIQEGPMHTRRRLR